MGTCAASRSKSFKLRVRSSRGAGAGGGGSIASSIAAWHSAAEARVKAVCSLMVPSGIRSLPCNSLCTAAEASMVGHVETDHVRSGLMKKESIARGAQPVLAAASETTE
jgi:hypothetical protein